jgi:Ca2+-binding RTX toxin-like protein
MNRFLAVVFASLPLGVATAACPTVTSGRNICNVTAGSAGWTCALTRYGNTQGGTLYAWTETGTGGSYICVTGTDGAGAAYSDTLVPSTGVGGTSLIVSGTDHNDQIVLEAIPTGSTVPGNCGATSGYTTSSASIAPLTSPVTGALLTVSVDGGLGHDIIVGSNDATSVSETLLGDDGNDCIHGRKGDDTIDGFEGWDELHGGDGNDVITGGSEDDEIYGGEDDDWLYGDAGDDWIQGDAGSDHICGNSDIDTLYGHDGGSADDGATDELYMGPGNALAADSMYDIAYGGAGSDTMGVVCPGYREIDDGDANHFYGQDEDDQITGGIGPDLIYGGAHSDTIAAEAGADIVYGGAGSDDIDGGDDIDHDQLYGEAGRDIIHSGATSASSPGDLLDGGTEGDDLYGAFHDTINGGDEAALKPGDEIECGQGNHSVSAGAGSDTVTCGDNPLATVDLFIDAGAGDDEVTIEGAQSTGLEIDLAGGRDRLTVGGTLDSTLHVDGGSGDDELTLEADIADLTTLRLGTGDHGIDCTSGTITGAEVVTRGGDDDLFFSCNNHGSLDLSVGNGANTATVNGSIAGALVYTGGTDIDLLTIGATISGRLHVQANDGDDEILVTGGTVSGISTIVAGAGDDKVKGANRPLWGSLAIQTIQGGAGNDILCGGNGIDVIADTSGNSNESYIGMPMYGETMTVSGTTCYAPWAYTINAPTSSTFGGGGAHPFLLVTDCLKVQKKTCPL